MSRITDFSDRRIFIALLIILVALVIVLRLFHIQVIDPSYKLTADNNVLRRVRIYPARGIIYDRRGRILVHNQAAYDMMVVPQQVRNLDTAALAELVGLSLDEARESLRAARRYSRYKPSLFVKQLSAQEYARIQDQLYRFPGFYTVPRTLRHYPVPMAAHLFGYVGEASETTIAQDPYYEMGDYLGISGIEASYEARLRGQKGVKTYMVDVHNRIIGSYAQGEYDTVARAGEDLHLGLDAALQRLGESLLRGRKGSIVALEPSTGEILCLVSAPSYDPNLLVGRIRSDNFRDLDTSESKPLFNRALMAMYPPGSTFKVMNALIGLQEGVIHEKSAFPCNRFYPYGRGVKCHGHAPVTGVTDAVKMSCNPYFCYVFRRIVDNQRYDGIEAGLNAWRDYLIACGLGERLGVDLPGELPGIIPSVDYYNRYFRPGGWNSLTILSLAIGQGELSFTPMQLANLAAIIANRGYYYTPHAVTNGPNETPKRHAVPIDSAHFDPVVEGMSQSVNAPLGTGGTSWRARSQHIEICGKTGTSQNPHGEDHSVFIGFAPKDNPQIAICVFIENAGFGGTWAAPIGGLMIEQYLLDSIANTHMFNYIDAEARRLCGEAPAAPTARPTATKKASSDSLKHEQPKSETIEPVTPKSTLPITPKQPLPETNRTNETDALNSRSTVQRQDKMPQMQRLIGHYAVPSFIYSTAAWSGPQL